MPIMKPVRILPALVLALALLLSDSRLSAQTCPRNGADIASLADQVKHATDADTLFRATAIGGKDLVPTLRLLSKPDMAVNTLPGAAQVSLAKLGYKEYADQLERELNGKSPYGAVGKLVRIGNEQAISILMTFVVAHWHDDSLRHDFGDYSEDMRYEILRLVSKQLQIGPLISPRDFSVSIDDWVAWWNRNKGKPIALSISGRLRDPYLQCLARKVEWGFPDAILDMANTGNAEVLPVLGILERVGPQDFTLKTIHGRAQFGLAKLGDEESFRAIVRDLDVGYYGESPEALRMIGGRKAVAALVNALTSPEFAHYHLSWKNAGPEAVATSERQRDNLIISALTAMVADPPQVTGDLKHQETQWADWWTKNQDTAHFVSIPVKQYE